MFIAASAAAQEQSGGGPHHEYLLLYEGSATQAANTEVMRGVREVLDNLTPGGTDLFAEYRDIYRFPGDPAGAEFDEKIMSLYEDRPIGAILVFGGAVLDTALALRDRLEARVPIVVGGVTQESMDLLDLPPDVHAVVNGFDIGGTLALARLLQPEATQIVVFSGSAPFDQSWQDTAREAFADVTDIPVSYVTDLTLAEFAERAAELPPDAILIVTTILQDAAGQTFVPAAAVREIAGVSSAPSYGVYQTFLGDGVVGGRMETFTAIGREVAEIAVAAQDQGADLPQTVAIQSEILVDAEQMARYGLNLSAVPEGATIINLEPSIWDKYRLQIIAALVLILAQTATIVVLLVQGRNLRKAEREVELRRAELAIASRRRHLGELSGAITHELNQPLTSILADAEAGLDLTHADPVDLTEIRTILSDIADADRRAAQIISGLRNLIGGQKPELSEIELNDVVLRSLRLSRSELLIHDVVLVTELHPAPLPIRANQTQLKQVLLNALLNAIEAMAQHDATSRRITVSTALRGDGWRVLKVIDNGPGLPGPGEDLFRPFATGKAGGLGLGLSVSRSIMETHGGTISFDESLATGACIVLTLPPPWPESISPIPSSTS